MAKRTVFITGATSGIGYQAALALARNGDRVIIGARNPQTGTGARDAILKEVPQAEIQIAMGDLETKKGVRAQAQGVLDNHDVLDVLVLNAGLSVPRRKESEDGVERTFAVNHLSAFRMAHHMHDVLQNSADPRVIVVASQAHLSAKLDLEDVELKNRRYSGWLQYCNTKAMNLLFTMELARRWRKEDIPVNAMHPGVVATGIARKWWFGRIAFRLFGMGPEKGADTMVYLATDPIGRKVTAQYFIRREPAAPRRMVYDEELQKRLWEISDTYGV